MQEAERRQQWTPIIVSILEFLYLYRDCSKVYKLYVVNSQTLNKRNVDFVGIFFTYLLLQPAGYIQIYTHC